MSRLRLGAFDLDIGKKFVRWGKVDLLSPLDVVNHTNTDLLALDDVLGGTRADPLVHVTAFPSDTLSVELVYVPFLAPDVVAIEELAIDTGFTILGTTFDVDARFINPAVPPFSRVGALGARCPLLLHLRGRPADKLLVLPRPTARLRPEPAARN